MSDALKQVIQDLINDRSEQALAGIHTHILEKVKGIITPVTEMAAIKKFTSGVMKSSEAKDLVYLFRKGHETADLPNGDKYKHTKNLRTADLQKGQVVLASYNAYNQGAQLYEVIGFHDGKSEKMHNSVKEMFAANSVKSLADLEDAKMTVKDLENGDEGDWFYVYEGRFVRGSGAEKLSFSLVEKV